MSELTLQIAVGVASLITAITCFYFGAVFVLQCWTLRKFSGPLALPLVGNCYTIEAVNFLKYLSKLRKKYGKTFVFFAFSKAKLIVLDPIVARRVLSDSKSFPKGTLYTHTFARGFGQGLVTSNGEKHKKDRAIFGKYFVRANVMKWTQDINDIADIGIKEMIPLEEGKSHSVNIEHCFASLALRVFMKFCTGADYRAMPDREKTICRSVSAGSAAVGECVLFDLPMWTIFPQVRLIDKAVAEVSKEFRFAVKNRQEQLARGENLDTDDCLSAMLREDMSEKDMEEHFITLICAGHDTSAYFNSYLVYLLAKHPEVQDKLRAEVLGYFQGRTHVTPDDIVQLEYLAKVMQETLRFYAIIPIVSRTSAQEVHIKEGNVTIPKGVEMLIPVAIMNRDPTIWENPSVFNPDRFEGKSVDFTSAKNGFFPFGYGSRTCIGNTLAQIESGIFLCKLLMRMKFEEDPGFKIRILSGISLTTKGGINVCCRPL